MGIALASNIFSPLSLIILVFLLFLLYGYHNSSKKKLYYPPGLRPLPIIGHLYQFLRHRKRFLFWSTEFLAYSPTNTIVFQRPGGVHVVITANPANVEHMLKTHFNNYPKGDKFRSNLHDFLGHGIFNSDGPVWRLQRKTASYEFNSRSFLSFVHCTVANEISNNLFPLLLRSAKSGDPIDLQDTLERFAFDIICKVAFGVDPSRTEVVLTSRFAAAFSDATMLSAERFRYVVPEFWKIKKWFNIGSEKKLHQCIATVHEFAMQIIRTRKKYLHLRTAGCEDDLLSRFIADENNSDEFLRDIIISFLLAGRETTSSALTWFFWLLSTRLDVERRILNELATIRGGSTAPTALNLEELRQMHYLHAAVTESMRLYPPVPFNSTVCYNDEVLPDGTEIKKGWFFSYNAYAMGRMEGIWGEDCREYRPERWLDGASNEFRPASPFRFPAFNGGPRMCLGKEMAYIQMKSIIACLLQQFQVEVLLEKDKCPEHLLSLTLRMEGGLPVRIGVRRDNNGPHDIN